MAAVTICSDFGVQKYKVCHCFWCFPIYLTWSDGTRCHDLRFLNVEFSFSSLIPRMSMFTLAISCLTTSNLPWFMDLTFQVPMQYCSLQHQTLLVSPVTSTTGWCFFFGSVLSFFLELFLHWSPVAYWAPTDLRSSSFSVLSFCLFILFMGFSRQEYWSGLHSLLQWTMFCQNSLDGPTRHGS